MTSFPPPAFKTTSIGFTPHKRGELAPTCGIHTMRHKLVVDAAPAAPLP